ncbi:unnamed protein product [Staurois parvus]|uniref:Uncharacterized protein n=1 Tax=Staurois parvus TaxID=386267 RepID=A0ABN9CTL2_9NEOB|nr:unnamed protein product [Staurois parvus]
MSVGGIGPHRWSASLSGRNSAPSLVSLIPMMGHYSSH